MQSDRIQILERKLKGLFPFDEIRERARAIVAELIPGVAGERVTLAALKLAGSDLGEIRRCVDAARTDYRNILAWAEYPRQMRLGASAPAAEREAAGRRFVLLVPHNMPLTTAHLTDRWSILVNVI